jgi:hypothetical protein
MSGERPARVDRPLPVQTPAAFLRVRPRKKICGTPQTSRGRSCARSHRVTRI